MNTNSKYVIIFVNMESIAKHLLSILSTKYIIEKKDKKNKNKLLLSTTYQWRQHELPFQIDIDNNI